MYAAFVDQGNADDEVIRKDLWEAQTLHICVNGRLLNPVKRLYDGIRHERK